MSEAGADQRAALWFEQRRDNWREIETDIPDLEDRKPVTRAQALSAIRHYPDLARDVAIARSLSPSGALTRQLQRTYARVHRALFKAPFSLKHTMSRAFLRDAPAVAARLKWYIVSITLGFVLSGLAGAWLVTTYPELAALFASEGMIEKVQSGELWTDDLLNIMPSSLLSVSIFTNNIVVTLTAVSLGALYGLGTIYIIGMNGLMLGGVFAFTAHHNMAGRLFEFVCAHGFVELSVICIAGALGFYVGESIARPGLVSRRESFRRAVTLVGPLLLVCVVFLVGAGLIEGYVSPDDRFSLPMRLAVGLSYWALFLLVICGFPARFRRDADS